MNMNIDKRRAHINFLHSTIGEYVSETQFWDTTLICLDGMMCLSKLIVGLVFPELHNSSRFDTCVDPTIMIPDFTILQVQIMIDSLFDSNTKGNDYDTNNVKNLVKVELNDTEEVSYYDDHANNVIKEQANNDDDYGDLMNPSGFNWPLDQGHSWEAGASSETAKPKAVRIRRTCEFKLKVVAEAKLSSNHAAARKLGLEESTIRHWRKNEDKLKDQLNGGGGKRFRLAGGGNKQHHKELEEELAQWVVSHQNVKKVTQTEICKQALVIYNRIYEGIPDRKEFNASKGWLYRFLSRNNLTGSDIISFHERKEYEEDEKDYSCEQCGKRFLYESSLKTHLSCHTGEKPHVCSYCAKTFRLRKDMIIHERIHTGERPYSCHICGKSCYDSSNLRKHEKCHEFK